MDNHCDDFLLGTVEGILFWYIPILCTLIFVFIVMTLGVTIRMLYQYRKSTALSSIDQSISEVQTLFVYLLAFSVIYLKALIPRVVDTLTSEQQFKSWLLDAVVQPCLMLFVPIAPCNTEEISANVFQSKYCCCKVEQ